MRPACASGTIALARIEVAEDLGAVEPIWRALEREPDASLSPAARFDWFDCWYASVGRARGVKPLILVGRDAADAPLFVFPLVYGPAGRVVRAEFPGGALSGINHGAFRAGLELGHVEAPLLQALVELGRSRGIDLFTLFRCPAPARGASSFRLFRRTTVDDVYGLTLAPEWPGRLLDQALTRDMQKRLRKKERKFEQLAGYRYFRAETEEETQRVLAALFEQKSVWFARQGIRNPLADPGVAAFMRECCSRRDGKGRHLMELHALEGDGQIIAILAAAPGEGRLSGVFNCHAPGKTQRWSPGLVLLTHVVQDCARRRIPKFDLGPGRAPYKAFFCREPENLRDLLVAVSPRGWAAAVALSLALWAKSAVKRNRVVWPLVSRLRCWRGVRPGEEQRPALATPRCADAA